MKLQEAKQLKKGKTIWVNNYSGVHRDRFKGVKYRMIQGTSNRYYGYYCAQVFLNRKDAEKYHAE